VVVARHGAHLFAPPAPPLVAACWQAAAVVLWPVLGAAVLEKRPAPSPPDESVDVLPLAQEDVECAADLRTALIGRVPDELDQATAARYLVACDGDVDAAQAMHARCAAWRRGYRPPPPAVMAEERRTKKLSLLGKDRLGHPVVLFRGDLHTATRDATPLLVDTLDAAVAMMGPGIVKFTFLLYLPKSTPLDWSSVRSASQILKEAYPERLHRLVIWPTNALTHMLITTAKAFLDPGTARKIVLGKKGHGKRPAVLGELVEPDVLPARFRRAPPGARR